MGGEGLFERSSANIFGPDCKQGPDSPVPWTRAPNNGSWALVVFRIGLLHILLTSFTS